MKITRTVFSILPVYILLRSQLRHLSTKHGLWAVISISAFVLLRLPYYVQGLYVPDETWHAAVMHGWVKTNDQAFGIGYRLLGHLIYILSPKAIYLIVLRLLSFAAVCVAWEYFIDTR